MKGNFEECLAFVLKEEGGFVNHPQDPGRATNLGVTQRTYEAWMRRPVDVEEMKKLTIEDVTPIYTANYWHRVRGEELPAGVDLCVFDLAVNSGPTTAIKFLQQSMNIPADGLFGPFTMKNLDGAKPKELINEICDRRMKFLQSLSTWPVFGRGWTARVKRVREMSLKMSGMGAKPSFESVRPDVA